MWEMMDNISSLYQEYIERFIIIRSIGGYNTFGLVKNYSSKTLSTSLINNENCFGLVTARCRLYIRSYSFKFVDRIEKWKLSFFSVRIQIFNDNGYVKFGVGFFLTGVRPPTPGVRKCVLCSVIPFIQFLIYLDIF